MKYHPAALLGSPRRSPSSRRAWIEMYKSSAISFLRLRRSPRGGRGLKYKRGLLTLIGHRRSPRGGRGLKFFAALPASGADWSLSSRRAWIEILLQKFGLLFDKSRSPRGGRGLKLSVSTCTHSMRASLSSRRAWIEIITDGVGSCTIDRSLSSRRAWIEISYQSRSLSGAFCRSPRGGRGLK